MPLNKNEDKFEGEWENDKEKNGEGIIVLNDGIYKGILKNSIIINYQKSYIIKIK